MKNEPNPLAGSPPPEVPLPHAPLVRVVAQVRFPLVASIEQRGFIARFQEAIRKQYPVLRQEQHTGIVIIPGVGPQEAPVTTSWRFQDAKGGWRVVLAPNFLGLETTAYSSREDFLARFTVLMQALEAHIDPRVMDRVGVRYVDRVVNPNLADITKLVRSEVASVLGTPLFASTQYLVTESVFLLPEDTGQVTARWGYLPANTTADPSVLDPIENESWFLDLDAYRQSSMEFDVDAITAQVRGFAERNYSIFRWVVTDEFLRRYGGHP